MKLKKVITTAGFIIASITPANAELYMCQSCPAGSWSDGTFTSCKNCLTTGVTACNSTTGKATSCKPGYGYNSSNGSCTQCSSGYYSAGGTNACSNNWGLLKSYSSGSGSYVFLGSGVYKVILNGAGGGGGGGDNNDSTGGKGGNGAQLIEYFYLEKSSSYNYSIGAGGAGSLGVVNAESNTEAKGSNGGSSSFSISGIVNITAGGGEGGYGGVRGTKGKVNGAAGANAGNGQGGSGGTGGIMGGNNNTDRKGGNGSNGSLYIYKINYTPCDAGKYYDGNTCKACPTGQYSSSGATSCIPCTNRPDNATYITNATSNACNWNCNSGYVKVGNKCVSCNTSCSANITEQTAVSTNSSATTYAQSCGTSFKLNRPYGASVSVNGKVIGSVTCKQGADTCLDKTSYYICKDKLIAVE